MSTHKITTNITKLKTILSLKARNSFDEYSIIQTYLQKENEFRYQHYLLKIKLFKIYYEKKSRIALKKFA